MYWWRSEVICIFLVLTSKNYNCLLEMASVAGFTFKQMK